jgi:hypothetical protein
VIDPRIAAFEERLRARVQELLSRALASRAGDDPAWDEYLGSLGVRPLTAAKREEIHAAGVPNLRGALPVEVRKALVALAGALGEELRALAEAVDGAGGETGESERRLDALEAELRDLAERQAREYLNQARPRASLLGIFANAQQSTIRYAAAGEAVQTKKCACCGAARPDGTDLAACAFCGAAFFPEEGRARG